jgi:hypothetical protein
LPVEYVAVAYAVSAMAGSTPRFVVVGAALLFVRVPGCPIDEPFVMNAFTAGTFTAAGVEPYATTAVAPSVTPAA